MKSNPDSLSNEIFICIAKMLRDRLLHALDIFAQKLSSAQIHFMSFDKQSDKNGPCFAIGAISRTTEIGVDWHNSQKVWVLGRTMETWNLTVKETAENELWGQDTAVCTVTSGTGPHIHF